MELRHLRYFLAAAQSQSFTRASESLHITQPTLSHQIKQIEDELGIQLFDRVGRVVKLTTAGELFQVYAKRALLEVDAGLDALNELENLKHGRVTFGVLSSFGTFHLPPILADFNQLYPGIKITVLRLRSGEIEERLLDGELHFGVAYAPSSTEQINVEPLFTVPLALVVGDRHPLVGSAGIALNELNEHELIMLSDEYNSRKMMDAILLANGITPRIVMEMNAIEPILATVRNSSLATILSANLVDEMPGLHQVPLTPTVAHTVGLFTRRNSHLSAAARALVDTIRQRF
ncbi:transcriptional regulator CynR [Herminiimonas glaciei]|uniref:Transcriptional regulator CynR n=1 Tax=Herminiimonas glaciei TaxID=523788 RepID=A0ABW2IBB9_9BURK